MRRIGRIMLICLAVVGFLTVLGLGLSVWGLTRVAEGESGPVMLPAKMVLTMDLDRGFRQSADLGPLARLTDGKEYVLPQVVQAIAAAAKDPKVEALFATMGSASLGMAGTQELRDAIAQFRATGKPAVVFSESLGDGGNGTVGYYLASAFGQVWVQPSGEVALQGFAAEGPYIRGLLDSIGVTPQFAGRWEFKSAIETFTEKGMSGPHRENMAALLDAWTAQVVDGVAQSRHLDRRQVQALVGKGPFLPAEALSAGLVDQIGYRDQAEDALGELAKTGKLVDVEGYAHHLNRHGVGIAVITGQGAIHRGGKPDGLGGQDEGFAADEVADAFRDAVDDQEIKGILFRVDSPGGDYTASDTVWREVVRARKAGKPVVVSMGELAASGGYFVGMAADKVIAEPGTITGSIGVFTGKMVMKELWAKLGVNWDGLARGDNAAMFSANQPFTPAQWDRVNHLLDQIYGDFTAKASEGRHIPKDRMDQVARGRVWSGQDALRLGLVDQLGGFETAVDALRQLLHLAPDAAVQLIALPPPQSPLDMVSDLLHQGASDRVALRQMAAVAQVFAPVLTRLGLQTQGNAMMMVAP